jgi:hypothetical protein
MKTFFVMGYKGPISHFFHKRVFQHRTNWSIIVSQSTQILTTLKKLQMQYNLWHLGINRKKWVEDGSDLAFQDQLGIA